MKRYQAVVFDFDMTIADTSHVISDLLNDCAERFGYPAMPYEETLPIIGNTHEIMLGHVTGEKDEGKILEMREYYRQLCRDEMPGRTRFFPGVEECMKEIYGKGIRIGLLSLKLRDVLMASLVKYDIARYFTAVLGCEDVSAHKPDPAGIIKMLEILDVPEEALLYIGDSLVDEGAARNAGVDFAAMLLGGMAREQFQQDFVKKFYRNLDELREDVAQW